MQLIGNKRSNFRAFWSFWLDCLFPKQCFVCQNEGEYLCSACFDKVKLAENFCYLCNKKTTNLGVCPSCLKISALDAIIVAAPYHNNPTGLMVEAFKYNYIDDLVKDLGRIFYKKIASDNLQEFLLKQTFLPIPLHKRRLVERGYNQAELIARELSKTFGGVLDNKLLVRTRYTAQQAKLTRGDRLANIKEAFTILKGAVIPERLILVDDVITTGSTLQAAAKELKIAGAKYVLAVALCHG